MSVNSQPLARSFFAEDNPFSTVIVDVTHRCNMECRNCYIPNRDVPDMDIDWMIRCIEKFPKRTRVRIVGAEPTTRRDLPEIIRRIRRAGHLPILLSNGLKLGNRNYLKKLKEAGLRTLYLSMNGGLSDQLYEQIDGVACAARKMDALRHANEERMIIAVGMILVRGINESHLPEFYQYLRGHRQVIDLKLRSVGDIGRHQNHVAPLTMDELVANTAACGVDVANADYSPQKQASLMRDGHLRIHCTTWPPSNTSTRGRLTPDGRVAHFFEHVQANEFGY